jgi:hypothetical protein
MTMRIAKTLALALTLLVPLAAASARPAEAQVAVSLGFFHNSLAPYGDWHVSADFGYVWRPTHVYAGWRPYHDGRWVSTNVGWTFVANDAWGWATYHYGRWYYDPYYGWVWVPGYEWGPAWVSFYESPGYIGWAPLSPYVTFGIGLYGYGGGYDGRHYVDPRGYNFVEARHFLSPSVGRWVQPHDRNVSLIRQVRDVTRFDRVGGMMVNRGLAVDRVERATRSRVRTFKLADQPGGGRALRSEIRGDTLSVYRPKVEKTADKPAKVKQGRPAKFDDGRGRSASVRRDESPKATVPKASTSQRSSKPEERAARPSTPSSRPSTKVTKPVTDSRSSRQPAKVEKTSPSSRPTTKVAKPVTGSSRQPAKVERPSSSRDDKRISTAPSKSKSSTVTRKPATAAQKSQQKVSKPVEKRAAPPPQRTVSSRSTDRGSSKAQKSTAPQSGREKQQVKSAPKAQDSKGAQVRSKSTTEQQQKADKAKEGSRGKTTSSKSKKTTTKRKPPLVG